MSKVIVKKEKLAIRCEICHQTDMFNPKKNYCKRCYKFDPNKNNQTVINTGFISEFSNILFFCCKIVLFIIIPGFTSLALGILTICLLVVVLQVISVMLNIIGLPINETVGSFTGIITLGIVIIAFIGGFAMGIKITFAFFDKPSNTNNSQDLDISDIDNQPYYVNSKNIYS